MTYFFVETEDIFESLHISHEGIRDFFNTSSSWIETTTSMVEEAFKEFAPSELYYRLEQLLLLGFLEKEQSGFIRGYPRFTYRLSSEYRKQISD